MHRITVAGLAVLASVVLGGCAASGSTEDSGQSSGEGPGGWFGPQPVAEQRIADVGTCRDELQPLLEALQELGSRLNVGVSLDEYGDYVGDVAVAYDRFDVEALSPHCLAEVAVPLEKAYRKYAKGAQAWDHCVWEESASLDECSRYDRVQRQWQAANRLIEGADEALNRN